MSWDADLIDATYGDVVDSWNYTHNTNRMANLFTPGETWFRKLHGLSGPEGARLLRTIIDGIEAREHECDDMNPPNGWGNRAQFVSVLRSMHDAVTERPTVWECCG